jgi:hypothetical protein
MSQTSVLASLTPPDEQPVDDTLPLFVQFGFRRGYRGGHVVKVEVGGVAVSKNVVPFVSNPAKRQNECWWAGTIQVSPGVNIHLVTLVGVSGAGSDTERSTDQWFISDQDQDVRTVEIKGIGFEGYPLLKGRLRVVTQRSQHDHTLASVDAALDRVDD